MQTLADGTLKAQSITKTIPVTPGTLVWVTVIIALTLLVARNITALVEFAIADRLSLDDGARFAYTALTRYTVLILGLALGFRNLGINWGSVQWLAAAVSVGLGFGLQEIFGNFVSGLILLFERPVRVGDTITINGTTGTVTQIRIRATTILDWDGKVLVVPNKSLITSEVSNWTLNDTATRVKVLVGVQYGADTDLVRKILVDVACNHPLVKRSPEPFAMFHTFADSTLNFTLFAFTSKLADRGNVIHELHRDVAVQLQAAGISIAFPQRDVHLMPAGPLEVIMRKGEQKPAGGEKQK
jgi:potassium efflux system protein